MKILKGNTIDESKTIIKDEIKFDEDDGPFIIMLFSYTWDGVSFVVILSHILGNTS